MAAPALNLDLSGIAIGQPRVPDPIYNALASIQTTINSLGNAHIAADADIDISKTTLGTFTDWSDWTPTYTGFSANPTTGSAKYMVLGKLCFVWYSCTGGGTSNSTSFQMGGLPIAPRTTTPVDIEYVVASAQDAGSNTTATIRFQQGTTTFLVGKGTAPASFTTWTASGNKFIRCFLASYPID